MKTAAAFATLVGTAAAFAPASQSASKTALSVATGFEEVGGKPWDPLGLATLEDAADTFPNMFPRTQFLQEAEIKHGRMAMLAWTGVWATCPTGLGLGMHFTGAPECADWTKALGVWATEDPGGFGAILALIAIAEGESVGHTGDNWRNKSTKDEPGNLGFDPWGLKSRLSAEQQARYKIVELKNGRAAMIAMASLFAWKSLPGSVPIMDVLAPN